MLFLTTGANGTGKTLLTIKHVHELAQKESRPVCYNGRFKLNEAGPLKYWRKIDIKDWQAEPDGTIFVVDECHNDFPTRANSAPVPEYVKMLAEHRARGFDFFLITQHPMNIDGFVRRLIGNPGKHVHLKRVAGAALVSRIEWDAVNPQCEKPGSGNTGTVSMVPYPKEVYSWYESAQLHTGKRKIPKAVFVLAACAILGPLGLWYGVRTVSKPAHLADAAVAKSQLGQGAGRAATGPLTASEYVASRAPRIDGLAYTAPAYDEVTKPTTAPFPAACVYVPRTGDCRCFSQQATRLEVPSSLCQQIAERGFFMDWGQDKAGPVPARAAVVPAAPAAPEPQMAVIGSGRGAAAAVMPSAVAPKPAASAPSGGSVAFSDESEDERAGRMFGGMRNRAGERWSW